MLLYIFDSVQIVMTTAKFKVLLLIPATEEYFTSAIMCDLNLFSFLFKCMCVLFIVSHPQTPLLQSIDMNIKLLQLWEWIMRLLENSTNAHCKSCPSLWLIFINNYLISLLAGWYVKYSWCIRTDIAHVIKLSKMMNI